MEVRESARSDHGFSQTVTWLTEPTWIHHPGTGRLSMTRLLLARDFHGESSGAGPKIAVCCWENVAR